MIISNNCVVSIHYVLTDSNGGVLDSTIGKQPIEYLHGSRRIISGLEDALEGKSPGDQLKVSIPPEQAYGAVKSELIQKLPREKFAEFRSLSLGMQFEAVNPDGQTQLFTVQAMDDEFVTVDCNHPLAGLNLIFDVTIAAVRPATEQELALNASH